MRRIFSTLAFVATASLLACATATPQQAQRAEIECFAEARHDGFRRLEVLNAPFVVGNSTVVEMKARRHGEDFSGSCTYDQVRRHAEINLVHASGSDDWMAQAARDACREEAEHRRFRIDGISDERVGRNRVSMTMDLHRRNKRFFGTCSYRNGHANLEVERY